MSREQWGHGFHAGKKDGVIVGLNEGASVGVMHMAEYAFHAVGSAIDALESGNDLRALMLLRLLRALLEDET